MRTVESSFLNIVNVECDNKQRKYFLPTSSENNKPLSKFTSCFIQRINTRMRKRDNTRIYSKLPKISCHAAMTYTEKSRAKFLVSSNSSSDVPGMYMHAFFWLRDRRGRRVLYSGSSEWPNFLDAVLLASAECIGFSTWRELKKWEISGVYMRREIFCSCFVYWRVCSVV